MAITCNINVGQAVVVEVSNCQTHSPTFGGQPRRLRYIRKVQTCTLVIERDHRIASVQEVIDRRIIHRDNVELAVTITIEQPDPASHGLQQISHLRRRIGNFGDADLRRNIVKMYGR